MKKMKMAIAKLQSLKAEDFAKNILLTKNQSKVKGGANPWIDGPG